jgi:hypothetical protein
MVAWVPPAVGAALAWYSGEAHIAVVFALVLAPLAVLAVFELVARQFSPPARLAGLMRWIALPLAALTLLAPVAHYGWRQYLFYQPYNPLVPRETLFGRMHGVLYMPVDAARFIRDNDITGRCLNDWRWEGYLRWMCPKVQVFLGGRAHQVYREETDTLVTMILEGTAGARLLADQDVHLIVVPPQEKYGRLLTVLLANNWGQLYYDEYNMVIVDANRGDGMDLLRRCAEGKLTFPNERIAALSRAVCMGNPVLKYPSAEILTAFLEANRLSPNPVSYKAVMQFRPEGLEGLRWAKAYLLQEDARLRAVNIQDANGLETLLCRMSIAEGMARLAREEMDYTGVKRWQGETQALSARIKALQEKWNIH